MFSKYVLLKLKLQYFGHLMRRVNSLEKTDAGRDWRQEEKGTTEDEMAGWHHWLGRESVNSESCWWTGRPGVLWFMGSQRVRHNWATELNQTELSIKLYKIKKRENTLFYKVVTIDRNSLLLGGACSYGASLIAQLVKNPPAMQETLVRFLGQEDPLEKG